MITSTSGFCLGVGLGSGCLAVVDCVAATAASVFGWSNVVSLDPAVDV